MSFKSLQSSQKSMVLSLTCPLDVKELFKLTLKAFTFNATASGP